MTTLAGQPWTFLETDAAVKISMHKSNVVGSGDVGVVFRAQLCGEVVAAKVSLPCEPAEGLLPSAADSQRTSLAASPLSLSHATRRSSALSVTPRSSVSTTLKS